MLVIYTQTQRTMYKGVPVKFPWSSVKYVGCFCLTGRRVQPRGGGYQPKPCCHLVLMVLWVSQTWGLANSERLPIQREMLAQPAVLHESSEGLTALLLMVCKLFGFSHLSVPILAIIQGGNYWNFPQKCGYINIVSLWLWFRQIMFQGFKALFC